MAKHFTIENLIKDLRLEVINISTNAKNTKLYTSEVNRPGLQLVGFFEKFLPSRLQVIGNAEWQYLDELSKEERRERLLEFAKKPIPGIVVTAGNEVFEELESVVMELDVTLLRTEYTTSKFINDFYNKVSIKFRVQDKARLL